MATRETRPLKIYATLLQAASASTSARLELLDHVRLHNLRVPKIILEHGTKVLNSGTSIGDRRWDIMEQVVVAALDNGLDDVAAQYILPLRQQFPDSQRVKRLSGMALEAKGDYNGVSDCFPPPDSFLFFICHAMHVSPSPRVKKAFDSTSMLSCFVLTAVFIFFICSTFFLHDERLCQYTMRCWKQMPPTC
jgi:hypothetical protein